MDLSLAKKLRIWFEVNSKLFSLLTLVLLIMAFVCFHWILPYWVNEELKDIAMIRTEGLSGDKEKAIALADWISNNFKFGKNGSHLWYVFATGMGDCIDFADMFVIMSTSLGLPARAVGTNGEAHWWVEIFSEGRWINLDPFIQPEKSFDNLDYYSSWDGNFGKRFSYVFWIDENGEKQELTNKYTNTGELLVKVTENSKPIQARIIVKSHHLMEAVPNTYKEPNISLIEKSDTGGIFRKDLGANRYTIVVEKDIIPIFPPIFVLKQQEEIQLEEDSHEKIELGSEFTLEWAEFGKINLLVLVLLITLIPAFFYVGINCFYKKNKNGGSL